MSRSAVLCAVVILLGLTAFGRVENSNQRTFGMTNAALSELSPVTATLSSCTCSCGMTCSGSCAFHFEGCDIGSAIACVGSCCASAPSATSEECKGPGVIL